jgi:hypothetical protein
MMSNVEWVVDKVTGEKHSTIYLCCSEPFPDVRYHLHTGSKLQGASLDIEWELCDVQWTLDLYNCGKIVDNCTIIKQIWTIIF